MGNDPSGNGLKQGRTVVNQSLLPDEQECRNRKDGLPNASPKVIEESSAVADKSRSMTPGLSMLVFSTKMKRMRSVSSAAIFTPSENVVVVKGKLDNLVDEIYPLGERTYCDTVNPAMELIVKPKKRDMKYERAPLYWWNEDITHHRFSQRWRVICGRWRGCIVPESTVEESAGPIMSSFIMDNIVDALFPQPIRSANTRTFQLIRGRFPSSLMRSCPGPSDRYGDVRYLAPTVFR
ncbi:hypothetical protein J6590_007400 [Homalodisca vitripennis]|nr:hypothetical protein J6590_007400 [Homalodisca vitripennis]